MKFILTAGFTLALSTMAFGDVIEDRSETMKSFGQSMKTLAPMAKGAIDFDADAAKAALATIQSGANKLSELFPEGSVNEKSESSPKIWEDPEGFQAEIDSFIASADGAVASEPADLFELEEAVAMVGKHCKSCHQDYRIKKD